MWAGFSRGWVLVLSRVLGEFCVFLAVLIDGVFLLLMTLIRPLYNAELAAPEMRGLLVSFYQFATILGIMFSFWIGYASNYAGGTGETQSNIAWRLPSIIQVWRRHHLPIHEH